MQVTAEAVYRRQSHTHKAACALLRAMNRPIADALVKALQEEDFAFVVNATVDPSSYDYDDVDGFRLDYAAVSLMRKFEAFPLGIDTEAVAIESFLSSEVSCTLINKTRVAPYRYATCGLSPESYISYARKIISDCLGPFDWNACAKRFSFSGGASTRHKKKSGAPFYKFQGKPETTRNNARLAICAIQSIPLWKRQMEYRCGSNPIDWITIVEGSKLTTVVKTAKTDRCIAIEPCMNMYVQKGIGGEIRSRLRLVGINLNDQTYNQQLACIGSRTGSLATIDLASASDSVSLELVRLLLPEDWFEAMCLCRSEVGILPSGRKHHFEKISSMGNGFTFELESLIFWALSKSVLVLNDVDDRRLGVYGDDIVIHNSVADVLIETLRYCGFETNSSKTFTSGPFRESCGKHYFLGNDVTPFYIKTPLETLDRQFWYINSYRLWTSRLPTVHAGYQKVYTYLVRAIPRKHRYFIPMSFGSDVGIWASFDECAPIWKQWKQAYALKLLRPRRTKHVPNGYAAVLHYFNGSPELGPRDDVVLRLVKGEGASSPVVLEKGETTYYHSKVYVSWWDTAPCGVNILGMMAA